MRQFTIRDALNHFGWIYGMNNDEINVRIDFLSELLDLPPSDTQIKNLSGGQQRRVSLAVSLVSKTKTNFSFLSGEKGEELFILRFVFQVQDPELLILDEPTVGLDPVLRQKIWDYLLDQVNKHKKTVIITTHYIEEARQAHKVKN